MNAFESISRRQVLRATTGAIAGSLAIGPASGALGDQATVVFEDQTAVDQTVTVATLATEVDATWDLAIPPENEFFADGELSAGTELTDYEISLGEPLAEPKELHLNVRDAESGDTLARDLATVYPDGESFVEGFSTTRVDSDPDAGFNYPYFLRVPSTTGEWDPETPILVEPNNTGTSTDDFSKHEAGARSRMEHSTARQLSDELGVPLLIPVFPRPRSEPVDWSHYTHALDRETLMLSEGPLARIDQQLLAMVDHARAKLEAESYPTREKIMLNGFSAAGNFVDRFAVLHPERVLSVTAGGLNGMALLPLEEAKGHTLRYHVGIADVPDLVGEAVDLDAVDEVNQYLYMGAEDENDTLPYDDAWTSEELKATAEAVYGEDMIRDRFPFCEQAYEQAGVSAQFAVYEDAGHTPQPAVDDLVAFHQRSMNGDGVEDFGDELGIQVSFDHSPGQPVAGSEVTFDATDSSGYLGDIVAYTWQFGDEETGSGETVTHSFNEAGEFTIQLKVVDGSGSTATATAELSVSGTTSQASQTTTEPEVSSTTTAATDTTETTSPGFGVGTAVGALTGTGLTYWLSDRLRSAADLDSTD